MKTTSPCADHECLDGGLLERPRYFPRQLITSTDLTLEATYFRDKLRRHNRLLHGWGVVCGLLVCPVRSADGTALEPWTVMVEPGYALGPCGDEVLWSTAGGRSTCAAKAWRGRAATPPATRPTRGAARSM
jgi:hypothetical protein